MIFMFSKRREILGWCFALHLEVTKEFKIGSILHLNSGIYLWVALFIFSLQIYIKPLDEK